MQDPILFVDPPPKNLLCMVCEKVFTDPVIAKCGVRVYEFESLLVLVSRHVCVFAYTHIYIYTVMYICIKFIVNPSLCESTTYPQFSLYFSSLNAIAQSQHTFCRMCVLNMPPGGTFPSLMINLYYFLTLLFTYICTKHLIL